MKKILAFLLCAVMTLSVCVAAFPAHAADNCTDGIPPGDVNGDGSVGMKDIIILIRSLSDYPVTINEANSDTLHDGKIDMKDLIQLIKALAGWKEVRLCHWDTKEETVAADCLNGGKAKLTCKVCGDSVEVDTRPLGHDFDMRVTGKCTRCDEKSPDYAYIVYRHYLLGYQRVYIEGTDAENDISYTIENMEVENKILALVVMEDSVGSRITFTIQLEARKAQCGFFSYVSADDMEVYMEGTLDPAKFDFETQKGITVSLTDPVLPAEYKSDFTELAVSLAYLAIAGTEQMISESGIDDISIEDFGFESVTAAG